MDFTVTEKNELFLKKINNYMFIIKNIYTKQKTR